MKKDYIKPQTRFINMLMNEVLCESLGGNTGYDPDHFIEGGELGDDD